LLTVEQLAKMDNISLDRGNRSRRRQLWIFGHAHRQGLQYYAQKFSCAPLEGSAIPTKNGRRRMFNEQGDIHFRSGPEQVFFRFQASEQTGRSARSGLLRRRSDIVSRLCEIPRDDGYQMLPGGRCLGQVRIVS